MSTPQNICFFNTTKFWGGGEKWHFETAKMMSKTHNKTFFVCDKISKLSKKLGNLNITQFHISVNNLSFLNPSKTNKLINFYHENKIETVIFNSPQDLKLGGKAAYKTGIKNIVYRRGIALEVKKSSVNTHLFKNVVTHFIFNSKATKSLLEKNYKNIITNKKTAIIYNAIEFNNPIPKTSPKSFRDKSPVCRPCLPTGRQARQTSIIISNAGRLVEQKGQFFLIDIAKKLLAKNTNFKIQIAGEGSLYNRLKNEIQKENLTKKISLLGFVKDMKSFMFNTDIFVSTALWEGFGFVLAEAMAMKKPVLAFNLSSNPELIKNNENGFLIPPKNTDIFAEKLALLINNENLRQQMGEKAYNFAKANFDAEIQFKKLMKFID